MADPTYELDNNEVRMQCQAGCEHAAVLHGELTLTEIAAEIQRQTGVPTTVTEDGAIHMDLLAHEIRISVENP